MKFAYRNREFWCKGYYVDTVGKNTKAIKEYIADQLKRDREADQLSMYDPRDPFTGSKQHVHGWQANKKGIYAKPVVSGLCPKKKNHPLCWWILILFFYKIMIMQILIFSINCDILLYN